MFFFKTSASANYEKKIYDFSIESITGETINFKDYKNKVILVVNTASYCGFTKQYDELQELWDLYKEKGLIVLGVPSNSYNQEKSNNADVKEFEGTPRTTKPFSLYKSHNSCNSSYCFVKPQKLAVLTTKITLFL